MKHILNSWNKVHDFKEKLDADFVKYKYLVINVRHGKDRTIEQNDMSFELYTRIGRVLYGNDTKFARAECKLTIGCQLLRQHDPQFAKFWTTALENLDYGDQLKAMEFVPVTRNMSKAVFREYIDKVMDVYSVKGVDFGELLEA